MHGARTPELATAHRKSLAWTMGVRILALMVVLVGCAVDAPAPTPSDDESVEIPIDAERTNQMDGSDPVLDVCGLAAALPVDDICHHVCDPAAMAAQLVADGADTGACYQLYCQLTPTEHVLAGVCLAP
jgi:hypothetical protein